MQASVRIYSTELELLAHIDTMKSVYFERQFYECGSFSFETNYNLSGSDEIQINRLVLVNEDESKSGIITEVERREGPNGKGDQVIIARGIELKGIFDWRYVQPATGFDEYTTTGPGETIMKNLVASQAGGSALSSRQFARLSVAPDLARGGTYALSARWKLLSEVLRDVAHGSDVGHSLTIDLQSGALVYDCSVGVDRRGSQSVNGRAIFSSRYDTIQDSSVKRSIVKYKNIIYSAGQGVGAGRNIRAAYDTTEPEGFDRKELFVDAKTLSDDTSIDALGAAKVLEYGNTLYIEGRALAYSQLKLGIDYDLGDMVSVESYGETLDARIVAVRESWTAGEYSVELTYDRNYPDIMSQLKSVTSEQARLNNAAEGVSISERTVDVTNGKQTIIKYASGRMEIYGYRDNTGTPVDVVAGSVYRSNETGAYAYYEPFYSVQFCAIDVESSSRTLLWVAGSEAGTVSATGTFWLLRYAAAAAVNNRIIYHAVGRWRV